MADLERTRTLATAVRAAVLLRHFTETRHTYGDVPDERTALELHQLLVSHLEASIETVGVPAITEFYERPHFENTADTSKLLILITALFSWLANALGLDVNDLEKVKEYEGANASPAIKQVEERLQEVLVFDCREPLERAGAVYVTRERALFMLGQYWEFYRALLQQYGTAPLGFSPHPLLRFIVNARARIKSCCEMVCDPSLSAAFDEALGIPFEQDTVTVWEEWAQPIVAVASEAYEEARLRIPSGSFTLTEPERLFLKSGMPN